jgi:hypothetical protein
MQPEPLILLLQGAHSLRFISELHETLNRVRGHQRTSGIE